MLSRVGVVSDADVEDFVSARPQRIADDIAGPRPPSPLAAREVLSFWLLQQTVEDSPNEPKKHNVVSTVLDISLNVLYNFDAHLVNG